MTVYLYILALVIIHVDIHSTDTIIRRTSSYKLEKRVEVMVKRCTHIFAHLEKLLLCGI